MLYQAARVICWIGRRVDPIVTWVKQGVYVWSTLQIAGSVIAVAYVALPGDPSTRLAAAGMGLQIVGIWTVAYGLSRSRKIFNHKGLWQEFIAWMSNLKRVFSGNKSVYLRGHITSSVAMTGRARVRIGWPRDDASLEQKIQDLQRRVEKLQDALDDKTESLEDKINSEAKERDRQIEESEARTKDKISEATIGGLHIEAAGLFFLGIGVILSTIPKYIVGLFVQ